MQSLFALLLAQTAVAQTPIAPGPDVKIDVNTDQAVDPAWTLDAADNSSCHLDGTRFTPATCPGLFLPDQKVWLKLTDASDTTKKGDAILTGEGVQKGTIKALEGPVLDPEPEKDSAGVETIWFEDAQNSLVADPDDGAKAFVWRSGGMWYRAESEDASRGITSEQCSTDPVNGELRVSVTWLDGGVRETVVENGRDAGEPIIRPNTTVTVCVEHDRSKPVDIRLTGAPRGLFVPAVSSQVPAYEVQTGAEKAAVTVTTTTTTKTFSPRRPGSVDVQIVEKGSDPVSVMEFEIAEAVSGVVRMGVAVGTVVDSQFATSTAPGSGQAEIIDSLYGGFVPELVLGFAPFFERGGRVYEIDAKRFAPYFALGIVEDDPDGGTTLSLLRSVHVGAECEIMRSASVAATVVGRRVDILAPGYQLGGPVAPDAEIPTRSGFQLGFALVFNLSPEFLELARGARPEGK